jgi:hypothetical protein
MNPFSFVANGVSSALQNAKDSVLSYLAGVPVSTADTSKAFKVNMSDEQIKAATTGKNAPIATQPNPFSFVTNLPKDIVQGATRSALGFGKSLIGDDSDSQPGAIPQAKLSPIAQVATYGTEPVKPFSSQETIAKAKQGDKKSIASLGGAGALLGLNVAIDPGSLGEDAIKKASQRLAEETITEKELAQELQRAYPHLDGAQLESIAADAKGLLETKLPVKQGAKDVEDFLKEKTGALDAEAKAATIPSPEARATEEAAQNTLPKTESAPQPQDIEAKVAFAHTVPPANLEVKSKVNILDYLRTPENVLEKMGLGKQSRQLRTAYDGYKKELGEQITYLRSLAEQAPGKDSSKRIFQFLDGQPVQLAENEQKVANTIKDYLAKWADRLDLPKDGRISNYITHIFDQGFITKEFDPEVAKIIADKVPGSVYDPFVQQRLGKEGYVEDVWRALDAYVKRGVRKVNMDPALLSLQSAANELDLESFKYIKRYADNINLRPTEIDSLIDNMIKQSPVGYKFGQRPTNALTQKWRNLIYRGTLGLNLGSALRNLMQGTNTFAELGTRDTFSGYFNLLRNGTKELYDNGVLENDLIQDKHLGVLKSAAQKIDKGLFAAFEAAEAVNRGSAYYGAKAKALRGGMDLEGAISYAKKVVRKTQFSFGSIDTPVALQSDIMKTLAQLQTFNVKQTEFLTNMIKNKEFAGLIRWTGASLGLVYTVGKALGMQPQDLIPSFRLGGSPIGNLVTGVTDSFSSNPQTKASGQSKLKNLPFMLIPGGNQIKKTVQGISTVSQGKSTTATGKTRYKVAKTPANFVRAGLLGVGGLPENQAYYAGSTPAKTSSSQNPFSF